jgi:hypothetical protein
VKAAPASGISLETAVEESICTKTASFKMLRIKLGNRFHGLLRKHFSAGVENTSPLCSAA